MPENIHAAAVEAWLARAGADLPSAELAGLFARAVAAIWRRALLTLGEVTLAAIVDRVFYTARDGFPQLSLLSVSEQGVVFDGLKARAETMERAELAAGIRLVLSQLLAVLGNLTAEILTPLLHAELAGVSPGDVERAPGAVEPTPGARAATRAAAPGEEEP
jgi:hypothetical protein